MSKAKERAKKRDGYECQFCGMDDEEHCEEFGRGIEAHHIVKDRDDGPDIVANYLTVCRDCHAIIERTHANGLSQLKDILTDELDERVEELTGGETEIKLNRAYLHIDYGRVRVNRFETETVAAQPDGIIEQVVVCYTLADADHQLELRDTIERFAECVVDDARYASGLPKEPQQPQTSDDD